MIRLKIQCIIVIPFGFYFRTLSDFPAHASKNIGCPFLRSLEWVASAMPTTAYCGCHVDCFFDQHASFMLCLQLGFTRCQRFVYFAAGLPHALARIGFLTSIYSSDHPVSQGQRSIVTGMSNSCRFAFVQLLGCLKCR